MSFRISDTINNILLGGILILADDCYYHEPQNILYVLRSGWNRYFIREVIRDEVIFTREMSYEEAMKKIHEWLSNREQVFYHVIPP